MAWIIAVPVSILRGTRGGRETDTGTLTPSAEGFVRADSNQRQGDLSVRIVSEPKSGFAARVA